MAGGNGGTTDCDGGEPGCSEKTENNTGRQEGKGKRGRAEERTRDDEAEGQQRRESEKGG